MGRGFGGRGWGGKSKNFADFGGSAHGGDPEEDIDADNADNADDAYDVDEQYYASGFHGSQGARGSRASRAFKDQGEGRGRRGRDAKAEFPGNDRPGSKTIQKGRVRIIGGTHRSRIIDFKGGQSLRPTPDFVRERLFNWLSSAIAGARALDLYSGSGALGFEAASRGAAKVVMVDSDPLAVDHLKRNLEKLRFEKVEIVRSTAEAFMAGRGTAGRFDVVFLDPPYGDSRWEERFSRLKGILAEGALVYAEKSSRDEWGIRWESEGWTLLKEGSCGIGNYVLLRYE